MPNLRPNRAARRADRRRTAKKILAATGAAVTATALTAGVSAPAANAAVYNPNVTLAADAIDIPVITTGALLGLAGALGVNSLPISIPLLGDYNLNLDWSQSSPANVYNAVNGASPMKPYESAPDESTWGVFCGALQGTKGNCRVTPVVAAGFGAFGAVEAIKNLGFSAEGNTLWPLADILGDGLTNSPMISLINPLRPNGGIAARFAPLLNLLGVDTSLAALGVKPTTDPWPPTGKDPWKTTSFVSNLIDVTWEYNLLSDFPVTPNPFSLLNSLVAAIPPVGQLASLASTPALELLGQLSFDFVDFAGVQRTCTPSSDDCYEGFDATTILLAGIPYTLGGGGEFNVAQLYLTLPADDLPILAPLRLPAQIINGVLDRLAAAFAPPGSAGLPFRLGTPIADILQPALKILVNIGYSDVITPTDIANNPDLIAQGFCGLGGVCYDRAFSQTGTPTPFGSVSTLTPQEWLQVPGDILGALVTGITQQLSKPFFGIIEPAPCVGCAPADAVAPKVAATEPTPGAAVADPAAKTVAAEASEPAAEAPAVVTADAGRGEAPAPTVTAARGSTAEPGRATGDTDTDTSNRTRGRNSAQAQSTSTTEDAGPAEAPTSRRAAAAQR